MKLRLKRFYIYMFPLLIFMSIFMSSLFKTYNFSIINVISRLSTNSSIVKINYPSDTLIVHYIDVGQGDSELVQINNKNLLIDAGPKDAEDKVVSYIKTQGITTLDYLIETHPHEDHIGGMEAVVKSFKINEFIGPKIYNPPTTSIFRNLISTLKNRNMKITVLDPGDHINLWENVECQILSPKKASYDNLNNYSVVLKITYKNSKFLFAGDAEQEDEKKIINDGFDISSDVLKVGHHGSSSSSSEDFLKEVSPKVAVISCGKNNDYGHPHKFTLDKLNNINCKIYRTDLNGDIVITSDGNNIKKIDTH
ncbi:ComEC/Rec2 family competence protein [Clostridium pasteurianum]|uniref:Putative hydrolase (Metallo-beta-lactamase superfamily) n=1 Tax=Clostridium pasteurianum BC1 TaxID=86416 RepID=R4KF40_CLOPA|nr:ComEC/Rec2 family competence protein [Clostridium pasteurianum]AGK98225.1 putative hydrolase (metallo-beta-lactamase superfamily) [Clostridium pasteurianum BC1]